MSPLQCLFCDQSNPPAAKFCNECGTPLHFKPCPQCDGINGRFAESCYRCGAAFSIVAGAAGEAGVALHEVSGPVPSVASPIDRMGAANEARAAEPSPNDDALLPPDDPVATRWRLVAAGGVLAVMLSVLGAVAWNVEHAPVPAAPAAASVGPLAPAAATVDPAAVAEAVPAAVAAMPQEPSTASTAPAPSASSVASGAADARKPAQKASARHPRNEARRTVASARMTSDKRDARARAATLVRAPASRNVEPTRHADSLQMAVRVAEPVALIARSTARPQYAAMLVSVPCHEGRVLTGGCDVRLIAKGN